MAFRSVAADTASRGDRSGQLRVVVWYPASAHSSVKQVSLGFPFGNVSVARDAGVASGRHPLIVLSHGTGGAASSLAWLARALAANGYIVASPNHPGNNATAPYTAAGFTLWWLRAKDLSRTIDAMLADREFGSVIDKKRIGAAGFSLGGYTVIELSGGRTSWSQFMSRCTKSSQPSVCASPPEFPQLKTQVLELMSDPSFKEELSKSSRSYRDSRVRSVFAIAPPLEIALIPQSLHAVRVPVAILVGRADTVAPAAENAIPYAAAIPGATLQLVPHAEHYAFIETCSDAGKRQLPRICVDPPGVDRAAIHIFGAQQALQFFAKTLNVGDEP